MTRNTPTDSEFVELIESCFDSVWSVELLLLLRSWPERDWTTADLVTELRSSELVVAQSVHALIGAGLAVEDETGFIRYSAIAPELDAFVARLEHEYRTRPNHVRRIIVGRSNSKLTSFSDAFLLRKPPR
jgi:hypothetical protein